MNPSLITQLPAMSSSLASWSATTQEEETKAEARVRKERTVFHAQQLEVLERVFEQIAFPTMETRLEVARRTGLAEQTVRVWFKNKRVKESRRGEEVGRGVGEEGGKGAEEEGRRAGEEGGMEAGVKRERSSSPSGSDNMEEGTIGQYFTSPTSAPSSTSLTCTPVSPPSTTYPASPPTTTYSPTTYSPSTYSPTSHIPIRGPPMKYPPKGPIYSPSPNPSHSPSHSLSPSLSPSALTSPGVITSPGLEVRMTLAEAEEEAEAYAASLEGWMVAQPLAQGPWGSSAPPAYQGERPGRRERTTFNPQQLEVLEAVREVTKVPDQHTCQEVARRTGLDEFRVKVWFKNQRAKERHGEEGKGWGGRRVRRREGVKREDEGKWEEAKKDMKEWGDKEKMRREKKTQQKASQRARARKMNQQKYDVKLEAQPYTITVNPAMEQAFTITVDPTIATMEHHFTTEQPYTMVDPYTMVEPYRMVQEPYAMVQDTTTEQAFTITLDPSNFTTLDRPFTIDLGPTAPTLEESPASPSNQPSPTLLSPSPTIPAPLSPSKEPPILPIKLEPLDTLEELPGSSTFQHQVTEPENAVNPGNLASIGFQLLLDLGLQK